MFGGPAVRVDSVEDVFGGVVDGTESSYHPQTLVLGSRDTRRTCVKRPIHHLYTGLKHRRERRHV